MIDRVTVSVDAALHRQIKKLAARERRTFRSVMSDVLMAGTNAVEDFIDAPERNLSLIRSQPYAEMFLDEDDNIVIRNTKNSSEAVFEMDDQSVLQALFDVLNGEIHDRYTEISRERVPVQKMEAA